MVCILEALDSNLGLSTGRTDYSDKTTYVLCLFLKTGHFPSLSLYSSLPSILPLRQRIFTRRTCEYCLEDLRANSILLFPCNKFTVPKSLNFFFFSLFLSYSLPPWVKMLRHRLLIRHCCALPYPVILRITSFGKTRKCGVFITMSH